MSYSAAAPSRARRRLGQRVMGPLMGAIALFAVVGANVPTVGSLLTGWYQHYQITRPAYEAKYGLWTKLDVPVKYRVNGIHATLLNTGDVLIMAGSGNDQSFFNAGTFKTLLLNPVTMKMKMIPTPWDLFCAGHVELPDGNVLVAGGTARYENLTPAYAGGSMTVMNYDAQQSWQLPRGQVFIAPSGARFAAAFPTSVPKATIRRGADGTRTLVPARVNVWVDAAAKGKSSVIATAQRYRMSGLIGPESNLVLFGVGTPMTLSKQDFLGTRDAYVYDVKQERFVKVNSMNYARWYPTLAEMGNGMIMTMSGLDETGQVAQRSELFNPVTKTWSEAPAHGFPTYPATFLTENGRLFYTGSNAGYGPSTPAWRDPGFWNVTTGAFTPVTGIKDQKDLETSASVLLAPAQKQKIMVLGGGGVGQSDSATARTALIDMAAPDPKWVPGPDLARPTRYPISVLLPNDQVLVTGGSRYYRGMHGSDNRDTRIYDPAANSFAMAADSLTGRDYHSGGILLPDGGILTLGGNPLYGNAADTTPQIFNQEIDVYKPPYLFAGPRPVVRSAPEGVRTGGTYTIKVSPGADIKYLRLMRPDNPTHVTDVNQRSVGVTFKRSGDGSLKITIPSNSNIIPPGYYMLFAVSANGVPSTATWMHVS